MHTTRDVNGFSVYYKRPLLPLCILYTTSEISLYIEEALGLPIHCKMDRRFASVLYDTSLIPWNTTGYF